MGLSGELVAAWEGRVRGFWSVGIMAVILDSYGRWVKSW